MKQIPCIIFLFLISFGIHAQNKDKPVDWGVKGGFNSDICNITDLSIDGNRIDYSENTYRVGVSGSIFMRLNIERMYVQVEPGYNFTRGGLEFRFTDRLEIRNLANLSWEFNSLSLPVLVGYHIIKQAPYGLNFFAGPKFSTIFKSKNTFSIDTNKYPLDFEFRNYYCSLVGGVGITIGGLFVDFRYDLGLMHLLKDITYTNPFLGEDSFGKIELKNKMNTMSFSLGYIF